MANYNGLDIDARNSQIVWQKEYGAWLQRLPLQGACVAVGGLALASRRVATPTYVTGFNHLLQMLIFAFSLTLRKLFRRVRSCSLGTGMPPIFSQDSGV